MKKLDNQKLRSENFDYFVFGSLAARRNISRESLFWILNNFDFKDVVFDINLRKDFFATEVLKEGTKKATILKMNDEELPVYTSALGLDVNPESIISAYPNLKLLIVTEGSKGLSFYTTKFKAHISAIYSTAVDTVGAGDSITSGLLDGLAKGLTIKESLERASVLSSFVVSQQGAIPDYTGDLLAKLRIH